MSGTLRDVVLSLGGAVAPLLFSHGSENDPRKVRLSVERQYQPAGVTFLSIGHL